MPFTAPFHVFFLPIPPGQVIWRVSMLGRPVSPIARRRQERCVHHEMQPSSFPGGIVEAARRRRRSRGRKKQYAPGRRPASCTYRTGRQLLTYVPIHPPACAPMLAKYGNSAALLPACFFSSSSASASRPRSSSSPCALLLSPFLLSSVFQGKPTPRPRPVRVTVAVAVGSSGSRAGQSASMHPLVPCRHTYFPTYLVPHASLHESVGRILTVGDSSPAVVLTRGSEMEMAMRVNHARLLTRPGQVAQAKPAAGIRGFRLAAPVLGPAPLSLPLYGPLGVP